MPVMSLIEVDLQWTSTTTAAHLECAMLVWVATESHSIGKQGGYSHSFLLSCGCLYIHMNVHTNVCVYVHLSHCKLCWNKVTTETGMHSNKKLLGDIHELFSWFLIIVVTTGCSLMVCTS